MTFKEAKRALCGAITTWGSAIPGGKAFHLWGPIDEAITALDNAAYDRAYYERARENAADWHQVAIDRAQEIEHLTTERDLARTEFKREATDAGRLARERNEARLELVELHRQFDERGRERDRLLEERNSARQYGYDLREAENTYLLGERDRLKQDLEFAEHRREQAENEIERLQAELADARETIRTRDDIVRDTVKGVQSDLAEANRRINNLRQTVLARVKATRGPEADSLRAERDEARNTIKNLRALAKQELARGTRLTKALETLADRYHAQMCHKNRRMHGRSRCPYVPAVEDANKALAGESVDVKPFAMPSPLSREECESVDASGGHVSGGRVTYDRKPVKENDHASYLLLDDRKPKERVAGEANAGWGDDAWRVIEPPQPEIEAVLMGSDVDCACGCGGSILRGGVAYRFVKDVLAEASLFMSGHARKAARPKARTHPPYAAYTRFMRKAEEEERCLRKPPEKRDITDPYAAYTAFLLEEAEAAQWAEWERMLRS